MKTKKTKLTFKEKVKMFFILLFCFLILLPLAPIFLLIKDGKGVSGEEYEKMKKHALDSCFIIVY